MCIVEWSLVFWCMCLLLCSVVLIVWVFFFSSRRRHTRCALVTGVQTCALPISRRKNFMARIAGVNIPTNKRVVIALTYIHGIGSTKAKEITEKLGKIGRASCRERVCQYV